MKDVIIYTDGACSGNPGPGGWGCVLKYGTFRKEMSGFERETTNNRMELLAAIMALKALREPCNVTLYSDSSYLTDAFLKGWLVSWQKKNWVKSDKKPVLNKDLWLELIELSNLHTIRWIRVKGHADNEENNRCDQLATGAIKTARENNM